MKNLFFSLLCIICMSAGMISAQDFNVPKEIKLDNAGDYVKYEKDIVSCVNWLEATPLNEQADKRKNASAFLILWITGSPTVSIELQDYVLDLTKKNNDFLTLYMGGWTRFAIENPNEKDQSKFHLAGLKSIIKVYNAGKGVKKDKNVQELVEADEKGELGKWLEEKLKGKK